MRNKDLKKQIKKYRNENLYNLEIANLLGISERTVYRYLKEIREDENEKYGQESDRYHERVKIKPNLKFISTPSHGYLLVPYEVMNKYPKIKKEISDFSWITDSIWYLEEDVDAPLFMISAKIKSEEVEYINSEDDIGLRVMSPHHPLWRVFYNILCVRLDSHPCDARTLTQSKFVLKEFFPKINMRKTIKYFKNHGGFCDCEVLMNVEDNCDYKKGEM